MLACMYFHGFFVFSTHYLQHLTALHYLQEKNTNRGQHILTLGGYLAYISGIYFGRSSWDLAAFVVLEKRASVC